MNGRKLIVMSYYAALISQGMKLLQAFIRHCQAFTTALLTVPFKLKRQGVVATRCFLMSVC